MSIWHAYELYELLDKFILYEGLRSPQQPLVRIALSFLRPVLGLEQMAVSSSLRKLALLAAPFALFSQFASAALPDGRPHANAMRVPTIPLVNLITPDAPVTSRNGTELPPYNTTYLFDQLIDHNNPSLGTFKQRYWHTYENYEAGEHPVTLTVSLSEVSPQAVPSSLPHQAKETLMVCSYRVMQISCSYMAV